MKVFLKEDVSGVGEAHEIVEVADGYARNYLLPRELAVRATEGRIKAAREYARAQERRDDRAREYSEEVAEQLAEKEISFTVKAGETGRLYGSITSADIADKVGRILDQEFDKRWVLLERPIRDVGEHTVELRLEGGVRGEIKVVVEAEEA
ncbi:MAG: 50S ribosomal protein L9 [Anaerolineae bacterium]